MDFQLKSKLQYPLAVASIVLGVMALGCVLIYASVRPTQTPTLGDQFDQWMTQNSTTPIEISRVSCLDPTGSRAALCQFTATTTPAAGAAHNTHLRSPR